MQHKLVTLSHLSNTFIRLVRLLNCVLGIINLNIITILLQPPYINLPVSLDSQGAVLGYKEFFYGNILTTLLAASALFNAAKWRFGAGAVTGVLFAPPVALACAGERIRQ